MNRPGLSSLAAASIKTCSTQSVESEDVSHCRWINSTRYGLPHRGDVTSLAYICNLHLAFYVVILPLGQVRVKQRRPPAGAVDTCRYFVRLNSYLHF